LRKGEEVRSSWTLVDGGQIRPKLCSRLTLK
jgi:hypothetical protein